MRINIQTPGFIASEELTEFIEAKVAKVHAIGSIIQEANVCLKIDKSDTRKNKVCEIRLAIPGNDLFASRQEESFEEAVTATVAALKHQSARVKTERLTRRSE